MIAAALAQTGSYNEQDLVLFEKEVRYRHFEPGELILKPGDVAKSAFYIINGAAYQYRLKDEIDEVIIDLGVEGKWQLDQKSFFAQQPADAYISAFEKCSTLELSIEAIHRLITRSPSFFQLGRILDSAIQRTLFFDQPLSPAQKYQHILDHFPLILQKFPLKMIASFLKITPETLSRVRKKMLSGKRGS